MDVKDAGEDFLPVPWLTDAMDDLQKIAGIRPAWASRSQARCRCETPH